MATIAMLKLTQIAKSTRLHQGGIIPRCVRVSPGGVFHGKRAQPPERHDVEGPLPKKGHNDGDPAEDGGNPNHEEFPEAGPGDL